MRCAAALLLGLLVACASPEGEELIVRNRCLTDGECAEEERCDLTRQQCFRTRPDHPYQVVLKIYAPAGSAQSVREFDRLVKLTEKLDELEIRVPDSLSMQSAVTRLDDKGARVPVESEVTFTPIDASGARGKPIVVTARAAAGEQNLNARLTPETRYEVHVQPLVRASSELPPLTTSYEALASASLDLSYGAMTQLDVLLLDENRKPVSGYRARLEDASSDEVISSTAMVDQQGNVTLYADSALLAQNPPFKLALSLREDAPWRVKVAVDGAPLQSGVRTPITIPVVPDYVTLFGLVLDERGGRVPNAQILLESSFPFEAAMGEKRDRDWCRWKLPANVDRPAPVCSARVTASADDEGNYQIPALPGEYKIFATPGTSHSGSQLLATNELTGPNGEPSLIDSQPDRLQGSQDITLLGATRFGGVIRSFDGRPMPNVTVTARALGFVGVLPDVARFNRSVTAITDRRGRFQLAVDTGYFDLAIEPPPESGFAWSGSLNRIVNGMGSSSVDRTLAAPVYVAGLVVRDNAQKRPLLGARIEAYALVSSLSGGQRAIRIGQTSSDPDTGAFRLALPATIGEELCDPGMRAECDCGPGEKPVTRECSEVTGTFETCQCPLPPTTTMGS